MATADKQRRLLRMALKMLFLSFPSNLSSTRSVSGMAVDLKEFDIAAELQENVQMLKDELSALQTDYEPELDAEEQMSPSLPPS